MNDLKRFEAYLANTPGNTMAEKVEAGGQRLAAKMLAGIARHKAGQPKRLEGYKARYSKLGSKDLAHELYNTCALLAWCIPPQNPIAISFSLERLENAEQEVAAMLDSGGDLEKFRELLILLKDLGERAGYEGSKKSFCLATTPEGEEIIALEGLLMERFQAKKLATGA